MTTVIAPPARAALPPMTSPTRSERGLVTRAGRALSQFGWFVLWQVRRQAQLLPLLIVVQTALALGTVIGFGLLYGEVPEGFARVLVTGAPTATLIIVGLVMTPQTVAQAKQEGSNDWLHTLPVPRIVFLLADLTIWTFIALPGVVLAVVVGSWRYHLGISPAWWVFIAAVLISLTTASVGYAFACVLKPQGALLLTQLLVFIVMFFSPVFFPMSNLPAWLQDVHRVFPIAPATDLMRAGLDPAHFQVGASQVWVLLTWCVVSVTVAGLTLSRRR